MDKLPTYQWALSLNLISTASHASFRKWYNVDLSVEKNGTSEPSKRNKTGSGAGVRPAKFRLPNVPIEPPPMITTSAWEGRFCEPQKPPGGRRFRKGSGEGGSRYIVKMMRIQCDFMMFDMRARKKIEWGNPEDKLFKNDSSLKFLKNTNGIPREFLGWLDSSPQVLHVGWLSSQLVEECHLSPIFGSKILETNQVSPGLRWNDL